MSQSTENKPEVPAPSDKEAGARELRDDELEQVTGGTGLLLPAVQKVREAAARPSGGGGDDFPTEDVAFTYGKI